jgi:endonuclease YncB( thermonuclease family)
VARNVRAAVALIVTVALCYAVWTIIESSTDPTPPPPNTPLLDVTVLKDGDSWVASDGSEYRLGMVNTPEPGEPCHREATQFTRQFLADGFTADVYSQDPHGRVVAEVFDRSGDSLNLALARSGLSDDRYLSFRRENPNLARRLEDAFAIAVTPHCRDAQ